MINKFFSNYTRALLVLASFYGMAPTMVHAALPSGSSSAPVDFQADSLVHDQEKQIVTATGDVVLIQEGKTVKADEIIYSLRDDVVIATGNVIFTDETGAEHRADRVQFNDALKDGFAEGLQTLLIDGSRFTASNGQHKRGVLTIMKDAFYTPCKVCETMPGREPLWQIRASKITHDKEAKNVAYKNARFEVKGVPVAYLPYFSHPDGSVKRKSGFLPPTAGYKSDLGGFVQSNYYWAIAPDHDATIGVMAMTQEAPLITGQWRQRWADASLVVDGGVTYSRRTDNESGVNINRDEELRGHISVDGLWNINKKWRAGADLSITSDDQYFRQYDFDSRDVLENEIYAERFSGRNYAVGRLLTFQDLRISSLQIDQPHILPEIQASFIGKPGSVPIVGGRWSVDTSLLSLLRDDGDQDVNRGHAAFGWQKRHISDYGFKSIFDAHTSATFYNINDRTGSQTNPAIRGNSSDVRGFVAMSATTSYPVAKKLYARNAQIVVEPVVSVTAASNVDNGSDIPNEDSQDVQIDVLNIFENNRFAGVDVIEDRTHVSYGMRSGVYADDGSYGDFFIGQSYRFNDDDNPFSVGSGLDEKNSDVVGRVSVNYQNQYGFDYRFQLDNDSLSSQRHEVDASVNFESFSLSSRYLFAKALEGTGVDETREQITNAASYYINDNWRVFGSARHDLGEDPGLREAGLGVDYLGQCISWSVTGQRTLTDDSSGDSGTELFLRIGFKNLGEFETSGLEIGGGDE